MRLSSWLRMLTSSKAQHHRSILSIECLEDRIVPSIVLSVTGFPSPVTAGTPGSVNVTAMDSATGAVVTNYSGTVHFSSSDYRAALPADYTFTANDQGTHTFSATLKIAGTDSITATDTASSSITGRETGIVVNPAATSQFFVWLHGDPTAGTAFNLSVTATDAYGNLTPNYTGTITFGSSDQQAILPAAYTFTSTDQGSHLFLNGATLYAAGPQSVKVTDGSGLTGTNSLVIKPAVVKSLQLSMPSAVAQGSPFNATVTAVDAYGNPGAVYSGTVHFTSSDGAAGLPANYTFGVSSPLAFSVTLNTLATQTLTVTDTGNAALTAAAATTVNPETAGLHFTLSASASSTTAGAPFSVTVTALDSNNNVATGYTGSVHFTSTDTNTHQAVLPADYTFTAADAGVHTFANGFTLVTAGNQTITGSDLGVGSGSAATANVQVNPGAVVSLHMTGFPTQTTAGVVNSLVVAAVDSYFNTVPSYTGTVHFTSSDAQAVLPSDYTFTATDAGAHTFSATLKTASVTAWLQATDSVAHTFGSETGLTVTPAAAATLNVRPYPSSIAAGVAEALTVAVLDPYGNTATGYRGTVHFTSSDGQATLPANYTFTATDGGYHVFTYVTYRTAGSQTVTGTDIANGSITGTGTVTVNPSSSSAVRLTVPSSSTAGAAFSVTVRAVDAYGNLTPAYAGTVQLSSSDGGATLPSNYTFVAGDDGSHTFANGVTLVTAGSQSVTVTASGMATASGSAQASGTVLVSPAAAASLALTAPATATAGAAFTATITAHDAYGNVATGYTGTVHFTSTDGHASLPADYTFTAGDAGAHTFANGITLLTAASQSLSVADTANAALTAAANVQVSAAAASHFLLTAPNASTAGAVFSFSVTAQDAYGNTATGYTGTVHFTSSDGQAVLPADASLTNGTGWFNATLETAGTQALTATDTVNASTTGSASVAVNAAAASVLVVAGYPATTTAGIAHTFTVTARDAYGNIAGGYSGIVHFTSSDPQAVLPGNATLINGAGSFSATLKTAGTQSLTATDTANSSLTGTQAGIAVSPAAATHLQITAPTSAKRGTAFTITVIALDAYGNVATGYTGTIHFTSSDHKAELPPNYTYTSSDSGKHTFRVTLNRSGSHSITVQDISTSSIAGTANVNVA